MGKGMFSVIANGNQYPRYVFFPRLGGSGDGERAWAPPGSMGVGGGGPGLFKGEVQ